MKQVATACCRSWAALRASHRNLHRPSATSSAQAPRLPSSRPRRTSSTLTTRSTPRWRLGRGGASGMILAHRGRFGGYGLLFDAGRPRFIYSYHGIHQTSIHAKEPVSAGRHIVRFVFEKTGTPNLAAGHGAAGVGSLYVDDQRVAQATIDPTAPAMMLLRNDDLRLPPGRGIRAASSPPLPSAAASSRSACARMARSRLLTTLRYRLT